MKKANFVKLLHEKGFTYHSQIPLGRGIEVFEATKPDCPIGITYYIQEHEQTFSAFRLTLKLETDTISNPSKITSLDTTKLDSQIKQLAADLETLLK